MSVQAEGIRDEAIRDRPWLAQYDPGVPATLAPYPERTLVDIVRDTAA